MIRTVAIAVLLVAVPVLVGALWPSPARSQTDGAVERIEIRGNERIETSTIQSYLPIQVGDPFDPVLLDDSLKALFDTGLFADVRLARDERTLIVTVVENPIINRIAFEGNRRTDDETLEAEIVLRPRVVYTRTRVQSDVARILEVYRRSGRFAATVEPQIIELDQNRVDLVFAIDEGPLTTVQRISFVGNEAFSDARLREEIATEESRWWKILTANDTYDPDRLAFDEELLRRFYLSEGYADFRVVSSVAELSPDQEDFFLTVTLEEGERYQFGEIGLETTLENLDPEVLRERLTTREGDWYDSTKVEASIRRLAETLGNMQFAFVDITPVVRRNREDLTISITYQINEGPRVFVERIDIVGNERTIDPVIRREMLLVEGDPFNQTAMERSEARVRNLGYFETVSVSRVPGSTPDQTVIQVEVQEQSTGQFTIGAGFSSISGPLLDVSLSENNLLGRGQRLSVSATLSGESQQLDLSFTEPYFLNRDLSFGFDVFATERDFQDEAGFSEDRLGGTIRFGYPLGPRLRHQVRYRILHRDIFDVSEGASDTLKEEEGTTLTSAIGHTLTYSTLNSRLNPTQGFFITLGNDVAGLGGDVRYFRTTLGGGIFFELADEWVLQFRADSGYIVGLGEDVRISDRFFVGGNDFRGFDSAGIGARDDDGDALGGNYYAIGTVELGFPLGLPDEYGLTGRIFTDVGYLGEPDVESTPMEPIEGPGGVRVASGVGLTWNSPFGPILLDYAFPLVHEDFDETENFRFSFGTRF